MRDEVFFSFVLAHHGEKFRPSSARSVEDFALAVLHVLLDVENDLFGDAEILHVLGQGDAKLFAEVEEVVDGVLGVEHHGGVVEDIDLLCTKLTRFDGFYFDERTEGEIHAEIAGNFVIGGFLR